MMKSTVFWGRCAASGHKRWLLVSTLAALSAVAYAARPSAAPGPVGPSERPEAYFNGSSYIRLSRPISLKQLVGLSYRTCVGGELFSQRFEGYTLHVTALVDAVVVSWSKGGGATGGARDATLPRATLDNQWHWVALRYRPTPPSLLLELDKESQVISNVTWNPELVSGSGVVAGGGGGGGGEAAGSGVGVGVGGLVGNVFSGCVREGPQLEFHADETHATNVLFDNCPLDDEPCKDRKDVLREPPKDYCYNEPCMRHGTCISKHDKYECECFARYGGNNCEVELGPPCASQPCGHGGSCEEGERGDYRCVCNPPYYGVHCELEVTEQSPCEPNPCENNGTCVLEPSSASTSDAFSCVCEPGWRGARCSVSVSVSACARCLHGGVCVQGGDLCDCTDTGYTGSRCETNINECLSEGGGGGGGGDVCGHGVCYDTYGGYVCACTPGYTGERCETARACASSPCGAGGACVEEGGTYRCVCARGLLPPHCEPRAKCRCPPHSHCAHSHSPSPTPMPSTSTLGTSNKQQVCVCDAGYYGVPGPAPNCSRADTACDTGVCQHGATCHATRDQLNCTCAPGYKGTYMYTYTYTYTNCSRADTACDTGVCQHGATCHATRDQLNCTCAPGYKGTYMYTYTYTYTNCSRADTACDTGVCQHGATCHATRDQLNCTCAPGYKGTYMYTYTYTYTNCSRADTACDTGVCQHGATCHATRDQLNCTCAPGYKGTYMYTYTYTYTNCSRADTACDTGVCQHGATCHATRDQLNCTCAPGYKGTYMYTYTYTYTNCSRADTACDTGVCQHGATCHATRDQLNCTCAPGYKGTYMYTYTYTYTNCSRADTACDTGVCQHGATCHATRDQLNCTCAPGYKGTYMYTYTYTYTNCSRADTACDTGVCQHGATCHATRDQLNCTCAPGYKGTYMYTYTYTYTNCSRADTACDTGVCQHGATCHATRDQLNCTCAPGYKGTYMYTYTYTYTNCSRADTACDTGVCQHGATCHATRDQLNCTCAPGYKGTYMYTYTYTYTNCSRADTACDTGVCQHGATCHATRDQLNCTCAPGYKGTYMYTYTYTYTNCSRADTACDTGVCQHGATCHATRDQLNCTCAPGYKGTYMYTYTYTYTNCSRADTACDTGVCQHGATCHATRDQLNCTCAPGYKGTYMYTYTYTYTNCSRADTACDTGVCQHGATCHATRDQLNCTCAPGYKGTYMYTYTYTYTNCSRADTACDTGVCQHGATCHATRDQLNCTCAPGYKGTYMYTYTYTYTNCSRADTACDTGVCQHGATCHATRDQLNCTCAPGYKGTYMYTYTYTYTNCSRADTACDTGVCQHGATCHATRDQLNCTCAPGYKGVYCEVSAGKALGEKCVSQPCLHAVACRDTSSGFRCECEAGWSGVRCDTAASASVPDPCTGRVCNVGTCRTDGTCDCPPGYSGPTCELYDCRLVPCDTEQECVEESGVYRCMLRPAWDACDSSPCGNGTCSLSDVSPGYRCVCPRGTTGRVCDTDVDECALMPKICNNGVCVNTPGSYQCYCRPGYTGDGCEQDIDECLSAPCKNGATCQNLENNFECTCPEGFEGKDCSVNIDECRSSPCAAGATCVDGVGGFTCECRPGLTGARCDQDIDDCADQPCHHGLCKDLVGGFECECSGTGFGGPLCADPIDECESAPCQNQAPCLDQLADYRCLCLKGYTGKNCEVDIDECSSSPCQFGGVCLQRSNLTLYELGAQHPGLQVGPQPHMLLPHIFEQPFDYANASGVECVCVFGTEGDRCSVNVDECAVAECRHGVCVDHVGGHECICEPGWEGDACDTELDECQRYQPCVHGRCLDRRATWFCMCEPGWGGRNCSVLLRGCAESPCAHGGTCRAYLRDETHHAFNCSCTHGYHGPTCTQITTMSLERSSYVEVNTSRDEGYDISFRFKTTLGNGLLAMGRGLTYFFLELSNGRLNLHSSLLNKWEGVFIGSNLNDSKWQKVFVTINSSHVVLAANEEQTIYPISQNEAANSSVTSFPNTRLGAPGSSYSALTHGPHSFVGCVQDVLVNGQWVLPSASNSSDMTDTVSAELRGVSATCPRQEQCSPNPCRAAGRCEDHWTSFRCYCERPHLGDACQYNYTAATFLHESVGVGVSVRVDAREAARRALRHALDVSMFVRTRKPTGHIFYIGNPPRAGRDETMVGASLKNGELLVHLRFNQTPEEYTVGGTRLDNGYMHLIEVVRNSTLVQVKLNGTEYFRKSISAARQLDAQVLYLGGPPPPPEPEPPATPATPSTTSNNNNMTQEPVYHEEDYFKGVIQDVQISNGVNVTIVELFPLSPAAGASLPPPFGSVRSVSGVVSGALSDDACRSTPCAHHAACTTTFNDYVCECPRGYKGKQCTEVEFCQLEGCPTNSHCQNLDTGYECVSNATFDGINTTLVYRLQERPSAAAKLELPDSLTITFRSKYGGTIFHSELLENNTRSWFSVGVYRDGISAHWGSPGMLPAVRRMRKVPADLQWTTAHFTFKDNVVTGIFLEAETEPAGGISAPLDTAIWQRVVTQGTIYLGGVSSHQSTTTTTTTTTTTSTGQMETSTLAGGWEDSSESTEAGWMAELGGTGRQYSGCAGAVRLGGMLLPYYSEQQLFVGPAAELLAAQPHYALLEGRPYGWEGSVGCVLCIEAECFGGGRCADILNQYHCLCVPGRQGDRCEIEVDECIGHQCQNNATCQDELAKYSCLCQPGYEGQFCERSIDACVSGPCLHGGTCSSGVGGTYTCSCPKGRGGDTCDTRLPNSCSDQPCHPGRAICRDTPDPATGLNYTCDCSEGYVGTHCDQAQCELQPCLHGRCRTDLQVPVCECSEGWDGPTCSLARDACTSQPCMHGADCVTTAPNRYSCRCQGTGYTGSRCERDIDECSSGVVSCGPGECLNHQGSYSCICTEGYCGVECALPDPCVPGPAPGSESGSGSGSVAGSGPCLNGGTCEQRCTHVVDYMCHCINGWAGPNCTHQAVAEGAGGSSRSWTYAVVAAAAVVGAAAVGGVLLALTAQARRKRATRGTYSPSGQEYCNPRTEMMHNALKPPPEERLI